MNNIAPLMLSALGSIIALAMIAVIVSKNANTASVIQQSGSSLASVINAAVSPVTGSSSNTSFGSSNSGSGVTIA